VAVGAAIVVGALFFTAGGGGSSAPTAPTTIASTSTPGAVTTGPPGPTAPTVSVVESTAVGADAMAIGSSGTFSAEDGSGVVTVTSARWQQETAGSDAGDYPVIEVEIQMTSGRFVVSPASFGLQDSKGDVYLRLSTSVEGELAVGQTVEAGGRAAGAVAFDAPRQSLTLRFPAGPGPALLTWQMPD
jgi:hypothetical protein